MNILNLLEQDNLTPVKKTANEYCSPCPVCGGKNRFQSWPETNRWWCRRCDKSGDLIEYLKYCRGLTYLEACQFLGQPINNNYKRGSNGGPKSPKRESQSKPKWKPQLAEKVNNTWQEKAILFVSWSHEKLLQNHAILNKLAKERFLTLETVKRFKLGWNPTSISRSRNSWGLPEELDKHGKPKKLWFFQGLVIPIYNLSNELVSVKIRRENAKPRYYILPGSKPVFYFIGTNPRKALLVESELDAILLCQEAESFITSIATGSASNKPNKQETEILNKAEHLLCSLDTDDAGIKNAWEFWKTNFPNWQRCSIPKELGKDHTEAKQNGLNLKHWILAGILRAKESKSQNTERSQNKGPVDDSKPQIEVNPSSNKIKSILPVYDDLFIKRKNQIIADAFELLEIFVELNNEADFNEVEKAMNTLNYAKESENQDSFNQALDFLESLVDEYLDKFIPAHVISKAA
jgi:hypothetical protein